MDSKEIAVQSSQALILVAAWLTEKIQAKA
jgi:hypothetical protein